MIKPQQFTVKLEDKQELNEKYTQFHFELVNPNRIEFEAGQYVSLQVDDKGTRRSYSIASSPSIDHGFELLVDVEPDGLGIHFLKSLQFGQEVSVLGPMGVFTVKSESSAEEIVMIATGSGIAPFRSMVLDLLQTKQVKKKITLYWGMRFSKHLFFLEEFEDLMRNFPNFHFHPVLSKPEEGWTLCRGHVDDCLAVHGFPQSADYYLCGNKAMIEGTAQFLKNGGIKEEQIVFEKFW